MIKIDRTALVNCLAIVLIFTFAASACPVSAWGQDDPIEKAKTYPPGILSENDNKLSVAVLNWQLLRLDTMLELSRASMADINSKIENKKSELKAVLAQLPVSHRSLDSSARSQLAGKVLEQIIEAKLDVKTIESSIAALDEALKEENANLNSPKNSEHALKAAALKLAVVKKEYEETIRLFEKGSKTSSDRNLAQYNLQLSELELSKAKLSAQNKRSAKSSELASQIVQHRIQHKAAKARIAAA